MTMQFRSVISGTMMAVAAVAGTAEAQSASAEAVFEAMRLGDILEIMQSEGLEYADEIAATMFADQPAQDWDESVADIYDYDRLKALILEDFGAAIDATAAAETLAFFEAEPGPTIVRLEVEARMAMIDDAIEEASNEIAAMAMRDETPRFELISRFVEVNDLIETNVVGALNSNYAFYEGLAAGGGMPQEMTEDQLLSLVWSQEPDIRTSTTEWVFSYLLLAYQPLDDADIESYIAFSETASGQMLNRALFEGFDNMFVQISRDLGTAAAKELSAASL